MKESKDYYVGTNLEERVNELEKQVKDLKTDVKLQNIATFVLGLSILGYVLLEYVASTVK